MAFKLHIMIDVYNRFNKDFKLKKTLYVACY